MANKAWQIWQKTPFSWWQCQLNFALWCASVGCGVSFEDHLQSEKPHAECCEYRCHSDSLLTKQGANALSRYCVFMEEPPECLTHSVDLRPEGCCVRGAFVQPCLSFRLDVRDYTLEISDSVLNLSLHFSVVCSVSV